MDSLLVQSWALFALSLSIVLARLTFRRIMLKSFADLQTDDWIMVFLLLPLTASIVVARPASDVHSNKQGAYQYAFEELQIVMTWLVKACLLVLYWRIFPIAFSILRRHYIKAISGVCVLSFLVTQISLVAWCRTEILGESHCSTHFGYTVLSLTFNALTTILVLIVPIPLVPTPRRFLMVILMVTGISALTVGILARAFILTKPTSHVYVLFYIYETTLLVIFANLPFLTSLVVTATPARIRDFSRNFSISRDGTNMPLSPWPQSRRFSVQDIAVPSLRSSRLGSMATVTSGGSDKKDATTATPVARPESTKDDCGVAAGRSRSERGWPLP